MITICERCYMPISDGEPMVRFAHIHRAHADGSITWIHSYLHREVYPAPSCAARASRHRRLGRDAKHRNPPQPVSDMDKPPNDLTFAKLLILQ